jgi:hypothetical protein
VRDRIAEVNQINSRLDDQKNVFHRDIGRKFLDDTGVFAPVSAKLAELMK